jgi:hypothetical protein
MVIEPTDGAEVGETSRCPLGHRCESCGTAAPALAVQVLPVLGRELCLTLCPKCRASGMLPSILVSTAARLVAQHADHVRPAGERRVVGLRRRHGT